MHVSLVWSFLSIYILHRYHVHYSMCIYMIICCHNVEMKCKQLSKALMCVQYLTIVFGACVYAGILVLCIAVSSLEFYSLSALYFEMLFIFLVSEAQDTWTKCRWRGKREKKNGDIESHWVWTGEGFTLLLIHSFKQTCTHTQTTFSVKLIHNVTAWQYFRFGMPGIKRTKKIKRITKTKTMRDDVAEWVVKGDTLQSMRMKAHPHIFCGKKAENEKKKRQERKYIMEFCAK